MASVTKWGKRGIALGAGAAATALVLTGCGGADAVRWGRAAGLSLFSGSGAEAAHILEITPHAFESLLARARKSIKSLLQGQKDDLMESKDAG